MRTRKLLFRTLSIILIISMLMASSAIFISCSNKNNQGALGDETTIAELEIGGSDTEEENSDDTEGDTDGITESDNTTDSESQSEDTSENDSEADCTTNGTTDGSETDESQSDDLTESTENSTEEPTETEAPSEETTTEEITTEEITTEGYTGDPYTYAEVGDIIITKVYGNDGSVDAPVKSSFIELYNTTDKNLSLGEFSIYYGEGKSFSRLKFDEYTIIAPGSYFLIKCNEVEKYTGVELLRVDNYDLEWGVKIDNKEFEIVLAHDDAKVEPSGDFRNNTEISSYVVASLTPNVDIYRVHDLSKNKVIIRNGLEGDVGYCLVNLTKSSAYNLKKITPKSMSGENSYVKSNYVEVTFSKEGGVYTSVFNLQLSAPDGYVIYYTLNGKDPQPRTGTKYNQAIKISSTDSLRFGSLAKNANQLFGGFNTTSKRTGGVVVKAMAVNTSTGEHTAVYTQTYFVSPKLAESNAIIISLSLDEEDFIGSKTGAYYIYQFDLWGTRPRSRAFMEVYDKNGVKQGGSYIEFAVSGNGSSGIPMKSLRLYYKDPLNLNDPAPDSLEFNVFGEWSNNILGQNITTFERVLIRNAGNDYGHTYIRDAYVQRMAFGTNVDSMAYTPAIVYVNGEIWGVYNLRERYSPEYFNQKYGVLEENVALIENESPLKNDSSKPESWNNDYVATAGDAKYAKEFNDLVMYIRNNDLSKADVYKYVTDRLDVDSFIDYVIYETYFYNNDWPGNNIKVWKNIDPNDPSGMDTKWRFVLLDMDHCMGFSGVNDPTSNFFPAFGDNTRCGSVIKGLMENPEFRLKFAIRAFELMETTFKYENAVAILNDMASERRALLEFQYSVWANGGNYDSYDSQINVMRNFLKNRASNYKAQVLSYTGLKETDLVPEGVGYLDVYTDNSRYYIYIDDVQVRSDKKIKFEEKYTFTVSVTGRNNYEVLSITFISNDGQTVKKVEGNTATFEITTSGRIVVSVKSPSQTNVVSVKSGLTAGMSSVFYLTEDGNLYAWGQNSGGALGIGLSDMYKPSFVMSDVARVETSRGLVMENEPTNPFSTAVLTVYGELYTVGSNSYGQLGRSGDTSALGRVDFAGTIVDVKMGQDYMLILDSDNQLWGVGNNSRGQLGKSNYGSNVSSFQLIATNVSAFAASRRTTAYITTRGDLYVVGDNRWNKSHTGAASDTLTPVKIGSNMKDVVGGAHEFIFLDNDGNLYYAGWRRFSTFAQGDSDAEEPNGVLYKVLSNVKEAEILEDHIIMLTNDGKVYGYGFNTYGQMANMNANILNGTAKLITRNAVDIAAGTGFTVILTSDGKIVTYGRNNYGQAGTGSTSNTVSRAEIEAPK